MTVVANSYFEDDTIPNIPEVSSSNEKMPSIKSTPPTRAAAMVAMMMARTPPPPLTNINMPPSLGFDLTRADPTMPTMANINTKSPQTEISVAIV